MASSFSIASSASIQRGRVDGRGTSIPIKGSSVSKSLRVCHDNPQFQRQNLMSKFQLTSCLWQSDCKSSTEEEMDHLGEPGAPQCSLLASRTRTQGCSNHRRCSRGRLAFMRLLHQWL